MRTVGILIFEEVEVLDFCGPFEVFSVARTEGKNSDDACLFRALTIAESPGVVSCRGGLLVAPHFTLDDHPPLDVLVIPGGQGTRRERSNERILDWIREQAKRVEVTTSVCTGSFLLASAGLLDGKTATTHWAAVDWMKAEYPAVTVVDDRRFVDEEHVLTSAGVSSGIDMCLYLVERLHGAATADWTARRMEYERPARSTV